MEDNHNVSNYDYTAQFTIGEKEDLELSLAAYEPIAKGMIIIVSLYSIITVFNFITSDFQDTLSILTSIMFISTVVFFTVKVRAIKNYNRTCFISGKSEIVHNVSFSEHITVSTDLHTPINYNYNMVRDIKETNSFYLLSLPHDIHVVVSKQAICNYTDTDFTNYLFSKCTNIKKKKIANLSKFKPMCQICLIIFAVLFVVFILHTTAQTFSQPPVI